MFIYGYKLLKIEGHFDLNLQCLKGLKNVKFLCLTPYIAMQLEMSGNTLYVTKKTAGLLSHYIMNSGNWAVLHFHCSTLFSHLHHH